MICIVRIQKDILSCCQMVPTGRIKLPSQTWVGSRIRRQWTNSRGATSEAVPAAFHNTRFLARLSNWNHLFQWLKWNQSFLWDSRDKRVFEVLSWPENLTVKPIASYWDFLTAFFFPRWYIFSQNKIINVSGHQDMWLLTSTKCFLMNPPCCLVNHLMLGDR